MDLLSVHAVMRWLLVVTIYIFSQVECQYTTTRRLITTTSYPRTTGFRTTSYPSRTVSYTGSKPTQTPRITISTIFRSNPSVKPSTIPSSKSTTKTATTPTTKTTTKTTITTTSTTTSTTTTTTPMPVTLPAPETTTHFQMVLNKNFSEVKNVNHVLEELKPQVANLSGVAESRVTDLKIEEVPTSHTRNDGKMAVTFDVHPSNRTSDRTVSDAYNAFMTKVNRGSVLTVEGTQTPIKTYTSIKWKDNSKCSSSVCQNGTRCWRVQSSYSCVCKDCPRMPTQKTSSASTSSGLSTTNIIIIIVVVAVVALIIIIIVIVCVIRSSKDPEDEKYDGSHYSSDTEERYNTSFAN